MHMYITLTINSCNATSDVLEQEELLKQWACRSIELSTVYLGKSYQSS